MLWKHLTEGSYKNTRIFTKIVKVSTLIHKIVMLIFSKIH